MRVRVGKGERENRTKARTTKSELAYVNMQLPGLYRERLCIYVSVFVCVFVSQMIQASSHPSKQSSEVLTSEPLYNVQFPPLHHACGFTYWLQVSDHKNIFFVCVNQDKQ